MNTAYLSKRMDFARGVIVRSYRHIGGTLGARGLHSAATDTFTTICALLNKLDELISADITPDL